MAAYLEDIYPFAFSKFFSIRMRTPARHLRARKNPPLHIPVLRRSLRRTKKPELLGLTHSPSSPPSQPPQKSTSLKTTSSSSSSNTPQNLTALENPLRSFANIALENEKDQMKNTENPPPRRSPSSPKNIAASEKQSEGSMSPETNSKTPSKSIPIEKLTLGVSRGSPMNITATAKFPESPEKEISPTQKSSPIEFKDDSVSPNDPLVTLNLLTTTSSGVVTTVVKSRLIEMQKPPLLVFNNKNYPTPMFRKPTVEIGSSSRKAQPTIMEHKGVILGPKQEAFRANLELGQGLNTQKMVIDADKYGLVYGTNVTQNVRNSPPHLDATPISSHPPATRSLFVTLGIYKLVQSTPPNPKLTNHQLSLLNQLAKKGPPLGQTTTTNPCPTHFSGSLKRPSGVAIQCGIPRRDEPPTKRKMLIDYNANQLITYTEFQTWKLHQERMRQVAELNAEQRAYNKLWGTILNLQQQCMDYRKQVHRLEQQLADSGLTIIEKHDHIDNLEMLLGLALKDLKENEKDLVICDKGVVILDGKTGQTVFGTGIEISSGPTIQFGSITEEQIGQVQSKARLEALQRLLQKVGGQEMSTRIEEEGEKTAGAAVLGKGKEKVGEEEEIAAGREMENVAKHNKKDDGMELEEEEAGEVDTTTTMAADPTPME